MATMHADKTEQMSLACFAALNCVQKIDRTLLILVTCSNKKKEIKEEKKIKKEKFNKKATRSGKAVASNCSPVMTTQSWVHYEQK